MITKTPIFPIEMGSKVAVMPEYILNAPFTTALRRATINGPSKDHPSLLEVSNTFA